MQGSLHTIHNSRHGFLAGMEREDISTLCGFGMFLNYISLHRSHYIPTAYEKNSKEVFCIGTRPRTAALR